MKITTYAIHGSERFEVEPDGSAHLVHHMGSFFSVHPVKITSIIPANNGLDCRNYPHAGACAIVKSAGKFFFLAYEKG